MTEQRKISIEEQAIAVERVCMGKRAQLHIREEANEKKGKEVWPESDLQRERRLLVDLEAAGRTLTWFQNNREDILAAWEIVKQRKLKEERDAA